MNSVKGHIVEITLRHDASRVIQYLLQFGNQAQQHAVLTELVVKAVEICKTPYGHFVVLKAVSYCTDNADRKKLMHCLAGHFVAIGGNVIGARTVGKCIIYTK
jgi:pumilio family protein 6